MPELPATNALEYTLQRPWFSFLGARCRVLDAAGSLVLFARRKALRLREDVRVFEDEEATREALRIRTEHVLDWGATYTVEDSRTGAPLGAARRRFLRSLVRDEWTLLDPHGRELGRLREDSTALALVRRFVTNLVPQRFHLELEGRAAGELRQHFNPFLFRATLRLAPDLDASVDRRLVLALALLLMIIEGRQE